MNNLFLYGLLSLLFLNCNNDNNDNGTDAQDCATAICTEIFVTLNVSIIDADGNAVVLEEFTITDETSGSNITDKVVQGGISNGNGSYPLYHDGFILDIQNSSVELLFKGYIDGNEVVNAPFIVGADCCHVSLSDGNNTIVLP